MLITMIYKAIYRRKHHGTAAAEQSSCEVQVLLKDVHFVLGNFDGSRL